MNETHETQNEPHATYGGRSVLVVPCVDDEGNPKSLKRYRIWSNTIFSYFLEFYSIGGRLDREPKHDIILEFVLLQKVIVKKETRWSIDPFLIFIGFK